MSKVDILLRRIQKIHNELGGSMADAGVNTKDKFATMRFSIEEKLHSIEATQEEKKRSLESNHQDSPEIIKLKYKILLLIKETDHELVELYKVIEEQKEKPKIYSQIDIEAKDNKYRWLVKRLDDTKRAEGLGDMVENSAHRDLQNMKAELMGSGEILIEDVKGREGELLDVEKDAISRWKDMDRKIDEYADKIGDNVLELKNRALNINNVLERHEEKLGDLEEVVDLANTEMETTTKRLKKLIIKVRSGDKFCLTLCLLIVLIGLIVVAYNIIKI
ncbi:hypothetical protein SteCoe_21594 [Stentor coeruleus]|uniref:t-SNARE coiled-coil homology domain-containing protein n=1 Tax=Stentor coeruleus TaxID=5963 RepID=A0A1R2BPD3_9CILI|nr:hypothetical protein SteCoe_21594 [Stentor coeruleus]